MRLYAKHSLQPASAHGAASPISQAGVRVDVARSDDALKLLRVAERLLDELLARQQQRLGVAAAEGDDAVGADRPDRVSTDREKGLLLLTKPLDTRRARHAIHPREARDL